MRERFPSLDADDVIQETFIAICRVMPSYRYDPDAKGHFRNYLTGILRHRALRMLGEENRRAKLAANMQRDGDNVSCHVGGIGRAACPQATAEPGEEVWRESLFEMALCQFLADPSVADRTKRIFERTAINGESPESVAASFKMKRHAVDQAKSRAMARLREIVKDLEDAANG